MSEEPDALIALVRIYGGRGCNSLVYPTKRKMVEANRNEPLEGNDGDRLAER